MMALSPRSGLGEISDGVDEKRFYTTGEAARLLGVSFITVKRWIYSKRLYAFKSPSGRYQVPGSALKRLLNRAKDKFSMALINTVCKKQVAYLRELQVAMEDFRYDDTYVSHEDVYHKLTFLASAGRLDTCSYGGNRWFFPKGISWRDVEEVARKKAGLLQTYASHPKRFTRGGVDYNDYSEFLVERAMIRAGLTVVSRETYYFNGIAHKPNVGPGRPRDLDFITLVPRTDVFIGVQVKNRLEAPKYDDIIDLLEICHTLHLRPVLVTRIVNPRSFDPILSVGGRIIVFKRYLLQPEFPPEKYEEIVNWMGIPLGVYRREPDFLVRRFIELKEEYGGGTVSFSRSRI